MSANINRFRNNYEPLNIAAKGIIRAALDIYNHDSDSETIFESLKSDLYDLYTQLNSFEFDNLTSLIQVHAQSKKNPLDLIDIISRAIEFTSETVPAGEAMGFLVAIPVVVSDIRPAHSVPVTRRAASLICDVLKRIHMIEAAANTVFLERLISPEEGVMLGVHEVQQLAKRLCSQDSPGALQLLTQTRLKLGMGFPTPFNKFPSERVTSGSLVMFVQSKANVTFPMGVELAAIMANHGQRNGFDEEKLIEIRDLLNQASIDVGQILGINQFHISSPVNNWYTGVSTTCTINRNIVATDQIRTIIDKIGGGDSSLLYVEREIKKNNVIDGYCIEFRLRKNPSIYGKITWPTLQGETQERSASLLFNIIRESGIQSN